MSNSTVQTLFPRINSARREAGRRREGRESVSNHIWTCPVGWIPLVIQLKFICDNPEGGSAMKRVIWMGLVPHFPSFSARFVRLSLSIPLCVCEQLNERGWMDRYCICQSILANTWVCLSVCLSPISHFLIITLCLSLPPFLHINTFGVVFRWPFFSFFFSFSLRLLSIYLHTPHTTLTHPLVSANYTAFWPIPLF